MASRKPQRKPEGWDDWNPVGNFLNKQNKPVKKAMRGAVKGQKIISKTATESAKLVFGDPKKGWQDVAINTGLNFGGGAVGKGLGLAAKSARAGKYGKKAANVASAGKSAKDAYVASKAAQAAKAKAKRNAGNVVSRGAKKGTYGVTKGANTVNKVIVGGTAYTLADSNLRKIGRKR